VFPKQLQQFEASARTTARRQAGHADDLKLGMVDVKWSVEEYTATFGDDDRSLSARSTTRAVHAQRRRPNRSGPATATTSATSGSSREHRTDRRGRREADSRARAPAGDGAALHGVVQAGADNDRLGAREHHRFEAAGKPFVYLVPSAAIFALDDAADACCGGSTERRARARSSVAELSAAHAHEDLEDTISELARVRAIGS
jgi:hypothetical protein